VLALAAVPMRWWFTIAIAFAGCGGPGQPPPPTMQAQVELSDQNGAPVTDGQDVTLVAGAQGGFHVWLSYRVEGMAAGEVVLERTAHRLSDDQLVLRSSTTIELGAPGDDGWYASPAPLPMFMCPSPVGLSVIDVPIQFELSFGSRDGTPLASQSVTLVPHCPDQASTFCQQICSG
jgi:hypothetical protein